MRLLILAPYPLERAPSQRFRWEHYLPLLERDGVEVVVRPLIEAEDYRRLYSSGGVVAKGVSMVRGARRRQSHIAEAKDFDVVLIHREAFPIGGPWVEEAIAAGGTPIVFDFDDAIWLPNVSEANRWAGFLKKPEKTRRILELSRIALAGNEYLADYARKACSDVRVLPSVVDLSYHDCRRDRDLSATPLESAPGSNGINPDLPTVGWTGSSTTIAHLQGLEPVLARLQAELGMPIRIIGDPNYRPSGFEATVLPWRPDHEIPDLCGIDIGVMPLPDDRWASGKCGMKLIQYLGIGRPAVASPVGVNDQIAREGETGFLARTDDEWFEALKRLVTDPDLRREMGTRGRALVEAEYSVTSSYPVFLQAIRDATT